MTSHTRVFSSIQPSVNDGFNVHVLVPIYQMMYERRLEVPDCITRDELHALYPGCLIEQNGVYSVMYRGDLTVHKPLDTANVSANAAAILSRSGAWVERARKILVHPNFTIDRVSEFAKRCTANPVPVSYFVCMLTDAGTAPYDQLADVYENSPYLAEYWHSIPAFEDLILV